MDVYIALTIGLFCVMFVTYVLATRLVKLEEEVKKLNDRTN